MAWTKLGSTKVNTTDHGSDSTHNQSTTNDVSGIGGDQADGGGGFGQQFKSGHTLIGKPLKSITFYQYLTSNAGGNYSHQNMTAKHFAGTDKTTVRASSGTVSTSTLTGTAAAVTYTFSSPATVEADDCVLVTLPANIGNDTESFKGQIKSSNEDSGKGYWVTWADNGSFDLQTSRSAKYSAVYTVAATDTVTVDSLTAKKNLMIQMTVIPSGDCDNIIRFNNDSGSNYARRRSQEGGAESTAVSQTGINWERDYDEFAFSTMNVNNISDEEKLVLMENVTNNGNGAGNVPKRIEMVWKWDNTSNAITRVDLINTQSGSFGGGTEVTVYGTD